LILSAIFRAVLDLPLAVGPIIRIAFLSVI
jgi:hypothetical protein